MAMDVTQVVNSKHDEHVPENQVVVPLYLHHRVFKCSTIEVSHDDYLQTFLETDITEPDLILSLQEHKMVKQSCVSMEQINT